MSVKIAILTATRAEYGLLKTLYDKLIEVDKFNVSMLVTGMHLLKEYGYTVEEIEKDNINIDIKIPISISCKDPNGVCCAMAETLKAFSEYFSENRYDLLIVLGDRYETLSVCIAAMNHQIPIAHIHGGETTEGAIDEAIRHSITKMSYFHFTSMERYRERVIQLGENPNRVFCVGALGVENALKTPLLSKEALEKSLDFKLDNQFALVTYHPVTLERESVYNQLKELLNALDNFPDMKFIITKSNADSGGEEVNNIIEEYSKRRNNVLCISSLGSVRYLSALKYCDVVIGNSSSGIIEAPSFGVPTINIGDRQKGREQAKTVYNVSVNGSEIVNMIKFVLTDEERKKVKSVQNPYGCKDTSNKIVEILKTELIDSKIDLKKKFFDINTEEENIK